LALLRKENNSIRAVLHEKREDGTCVITPENPWIPPYLFYGSKAEIKMRCESLEVVENYLQVLHSTGVTWTERLITKEWALIGAFNRGEIPTHHKVVRDDSIAIQAIAWNQRIFEAGLKTQNYDKGFEGLSANSTRT
jgi:hypothetical protein